MKKILIPLLFCFAAGTLYANPGGTRVARYDMMKKQKKKKPKKGTRFRFDGRTVEGKKKSPMQAVIKARKKIMPKGILYMRSDFDEEIFKSYYDVK